MTFSEHKGSDETVFLRYLNPGFQESRHLQYLLGLCQNLVYWGRGRGGGQRQREAKRHRDRDRQSDTETEQGGKLGMGQEGGRRAWIMDPDKHSLLFVCKSTEVLGSGKIT